MARYSTTDAARDTMPQNVLALMDIRDNAKSEIAKVQAIALLAKLAKLDQVPEVIDNTVIFEPATSEKVIPLNAGQNRTDAAAN